MQFKTKLGLKRYIYKQMRLQGFINLNSEIVGRYMVFNGVKRDNDVIQNIKDTVKDMQDMKDRLEKEIKHTRFFIRINQYIPGYFVVINDETLEKEMFLLKNKSTHKDT